MSKRYSIIFYKINSNFKVELFSKPPSVYWVLAMYQARLEIHRDTRRNSSQVSLLIDLYYIVFNSTYILVVVKRLFFHWQPTCVPKLPGVRLCPVRMFRRTPHHHYYESSPRLRRCPVRVSGALTLASSLLPQRPLKLSFEHPHLLRGVLNSLLK